MENEPFMDYYLGKKICNWHFLNLSAAFSMTRYCYQVQRLLSHGTTDRQHGLNLNLVRLRSTDV